MAKKTDDEISGFFLIRHNDDKSVFEYTIHGTIEDISNLSEIVRERFSYSPQSDIISSAIEEMLVNVVEINDGVDLIDIIIRDKNESKVFSVKYSGIVYNPLKDENYENLCVLNKYVENIEYSQILELNNIEITLNKGISTID